MPDARYRDAIEGAIDALIALLDLMDGDPDVEDGGDLEPSLAHLNNGGWANSPAPDLEDDRSLAA